MYLLDTNALLIHFFDNISANFLSEDALQIIDDYPDIAVSIVSLWEIAIKKKQGKLKINYSIEEIAEACRGDGIHILPIDVKSIEKMVETDYPSDHKDPFDRIILSTALSENMTLISTDNKMKQYDVKVLS